jgi:hypothetical protein
MLHILKEELEKSKALQPGVNNLVQQVMNAIPFETIPVKMKAVIAVSHIVNFAGQFRRNVQLQDGTLVPINAISFVIAASGAHKDSSNNAAKKCFASGYKHVYNHVEKLVKKEAIRRAEEAGEEIPDEYATYKAYLLPIPPNFISVTTGPGMVQHINDISKLSMLSSFVYSGELSDELAHNPNMMDTIKVISECYDLGTKEATYTKGAEFRSDVIDGQAVSALFVGSPGHILYDETTKKKFNVAFMSKLARRSFFCYAPQKLLEPNFAEEENPIQALFDYEKHIDDLAIRAREAMVAQVLKVAEFGINTAGKSIKLSNEVYEMFKIYKRYNSEVVESMTNQESTSTLVRRHLQWKALKLAGAFAMFDLSHEVRLSHYVDAIRFCELLDIDMEMFEHDLNKSYHERFSDYIRTKVSVDGVAEVSIHDIKKLGFMSSLTIQKLKELVTLCAGYDKDGVYSVIGDGVGIQYIPIIKTDTIGASFKPIDNTEVNLAIETGADETVLREAKNKVGMTTAYGYEVVDTTFPDLINLLEGDFAYSPFKFRNGVRGKDYIMSATKWIVFDIDDSSMTASEVHFMLSDLNHYVALSSNPNNEFKFKVIIELDSPVDLSPIAWKHFCQAIAEDLALRIDPLPQSQIFFAYAGRPVMSNLEGLPLAVRDYVMAAKEKEANKDNAIKSITNPQRKALLEDKLNTFSFAYECENGTCSRSVIRAILYAKDLGADLHYALGLFEEIQEYWEYPFAEERQEAMRNQITRMFT